MSITLRPAGPSDIPFIVACERRPDYERFVGRWPEQKHARWMADEAFTYLVGSDEQGDVGFVILYDSWLRPENLYLKRIAVHDAEKGNGKHLLAAVQDWVFANTNAHRFWLEVVEHNLRARHVYTTMGWAEEGIVREAYFEDASNCRRSFVQMSILKHEWLGRRR